MNIQTTNNIRGFTLVELIGIVLVLSAVFLLCFPNFLNMAKDSKEEEYNSMVKDLCLAGENYIYSNMVDFPQLKEVNQTIEIPIQQLILYGNVKDNIINSKTNKTINNSILKYTVLENNLLDCNYIEG